MCFFVLLCPFMSLYVPFCSFLLSLLAGYCGRRTKRDMRPMLYNKDINLSDIKFSENLYFKIIPMGAFHCFKLK